MSIPQLEAAERMRCIPIDLRNELIEAGENVCDGRPRFEYHKRQQEIADAYRSPATPKQD